LIDVGFFEPLQMLLNNGRIRPTPESVWTYFVRAPSTIENSKWHVTQAGLDLYWAVIDAAHAALMKVGEIPPSPKEVGNMIEEKFVKTKRLNKKYANIMREFYDLSKGIMHREIRYLSGDEYDGYLKKAQDFVEEIKLIVEGKK